MSIENTIISLLYRYDCVIVPGFGAFISQKTPAQIDNKTDTIYPPSKAIGFNSQLKTNDGLLLQTLASLEKVSYSEMTSMLEEKIADWKNLINATGTLNFSKLGRFSLNAEQHIVFEPKANQNFLKSSFGLSPVLAKPFNIEKQVFLKGQNNSTIEKQPLGENNSNYSFLKYAAVVIILISLCLIGVREFAPTPMTDSVVYQTVQKRMQTATFFDANPIKLPALNLNFKEKKAYTSVSYHIVIGAYRVSDNAQKKIQQLTKKGYTPSYIGKNDFGFHLVSIEKFSDKSIALRVLQSIRRQENMDAWILEH